MFKFAVPMKLFKRNLGCTKCAQISIESQIFICVETA